MKYVIKNCPAYSCNGVCCADYDLYCKDYNNCLLKRIVGLCKENYTSDDNVFDNVFDVSKQIFAERILDLIEIEEVE